MLLWPLSSVVLLGLLGFLSATPTIDQKLLEDMTATRNAQSAELCKYLNDSVDPCENFYDFACGNWKTYNPANESVWRTRAFEKALESTTPQLIELLLKTNETDTEAEQKMKGYYKLCLGYRTVEKSQHIRKVKEIVDDLLKMPALEGDQWSEQNFDWLKTVAEISHKYGVNILLGYELDYNKFNHSTYDIHLSNRFFWAAGSEFKRFLENIVGISEAMLPQVAQELNNFEEILEEAYNEAVEESITLEDLHQKYFPDLDVKKLLNISYGPARPNDKLFYYKPAYFKTLIEVMAKTPKRIVANYIYYSIFTEFWISLPGENKNLERFCIRQIKEEFKDVASYMIYRSSDFKEVELKFAQLWQDVKSSLQILVQSSRLSALDEDYRKYALEKLQHVRLVIPTYQDVNLDAKYHQLSVEQNYVESVKSLKALKASQTRYKLNIEPLHIDEGLAISSSIYIMTANAVIVPIVMLQNEYFYSKYYPNVLLWARLGTALGHELFHALSGDSRKYSKLGDYIGDLGEHVEREVEKNRQCLYDQYTNYTYGDTPLPQAEEQDENMADIAGTLLAYHCYRKWYDDAERTPDELNRETFPNLNYTPEQLFFIASAQRWCADTKESDKRYVTFYHSHSPDEFRSFVPLTNLEGFSEAFQCPLGTAMNPEKKCNIL